MAELHEQLLLGVGVNGPHFVAHWQSPDLPAPTVTAVIESKPGRNGWLLLQQETDDDDRA